MYGLLNGIGVTDDMKKSSYEQIVMSKMRRCQWGGTIVKRRTYGIQVRFFFAHGRFHDGFI